MDTRYTDLCSVAKSRLTLCDPMDFRTPGFSVLHCLLEFTQTHVHWVSDAILCCLLLILPSNFPSIRIFSSESALCIRWPDYWSFSFSISPSNEYSGLISIRIDWFDILVIQGTLKIVFFSTTVWRYQFFHTQPFLSSSHIHTWLLEKSDLWLYGPLKTK